MRDLIREMLEADPKEGITCTLEELTEYAATLTAEASYQALKEASN